MRKVNIVILAGLVMFALSRLVFADDFEDIVQKHKHKVSKILATTNDLGAVPYRDSVVNGLSNPNGEIIVTNYVTTVGDLYKPAHPIAGEAYQLLDPRGNIIALIRGETSVRGNMEGKLLQVTADKITYNPAYPDLLIMVEVTDSGVLTPGSILSSRQIDVNEDGVINANDIADTSMHFGPVQGIDRVYDLNYDGVVDGKDIFIISAFTGYNADDAWTGWPDLNNDGMANVHDVIMLADHLGETVNGYQNKLCDLNQDGKIDEKDLGILRAFYGYGTYAWYAPPDTGMPLVESKNGKIVSVIFFSGDNKTADKYTFDGNGKIITSVHYGEEGAAPYDGPMPLVEFINSKISTITIFDFSGRPQHKYTFSADGKIIQSEHYTHIEPPNFVLLPEKPEYPITEGPFNPGDNTNTPIITLPVVPKEPISGEPLTIVPPQGVKEPIKSPDITLPIDNKNGGSAGVTIVVNKEADDKMSVIESSKTSLPEGVSITGKMATDNKETIAPPGN